MARHYLFLAVGALALTACTSEDVVDDVAAYSNVIKFETVVNKPSRAVEDLNSSTFNQFNVFGFYTMPDNAKHAHEVFNDVPVSFKNGAWSYKDEYTRYWVPNATYYFYAYSCGSDSQLNPNYGKFSINSANFDEDGNELNLDAEQRTLKITGYVCDQFHQHDLVFASKPAFKPLATTNAPVAFSFNHILSKVSARFTSTFANEYDVVIKDVYINNVCNIGNFDSAAGWSGVARKTGQTPRVYLLNTKGDNIETAEGNIKVTNAKDDKGNQVYVETQSAYVLPWMYEDKDVNICFTIDVMYGNDKIIDSKPLTATFKPEWEMGKYYIYTIDVNPVDIDMNQITFNVDIVNGWGTPQNGGTIGIDSNKQNP